MFQIKRRSGYPAVSSQHQQLAETPRYGAAGKPGARCRHGAGDKPQPCSCIGHLSG